MADSAFQRQRAVSNVRNRAAHVNEPEDAVWPGLEVPSASVTCCACAAEVRNSPCRRATGDAMHLAKVSCPYIRPQSIACATGARYDKQRTGGRVSGGRLVRKRAMHGELAGRSRSKPGADSEGGRRRRRQATRRAPARRGQCGVTRTRGRRGDLFLGRQLLNVSARVRSSTTFDTHEKAHVAS